MNFPTYDFLESMANGMVTVDFGIYLQNGNINEEQYNTLTKINAESVDKYNKMFQ